MSWMEHSVKRSSLQRTNRVDEDEGMEDNSLYSGRETVCDFRVCVRRTEASERCRLKGDGVLRADTDALHLLNKTGEVLFTWPYRYLRRFGRDKATFSFEAGRRCDSGEGSFEFDTRQGNFLFQAVEAAINLQRIALPHRQTSGGGQASPETPQDLNLPLNPPLIHIRMPPLLQPHSHVPQPPAAQADSVYSVVTESPNLQSAQHKDRESCTQQQQQQHRPLMSRLEPPVDKALTAVKSLTLDTRGAPVPRKNQVKMIPSCPLPHAGPETGPSSAPSPHLSPKLGSNQNPDQTYSQISLPAPTKRSAKREKSVGPPSTPPLVALEPEYSLPFDTIAVNVTTNILSSHQGQRPECADPLYDSIDEMKIRNIFLSTAAAAGPTYGKVEHIYDEPEGCAAATTATAAAAAQKPPASLYDDPEEMRGDAWRIMGTTGDPKGHEYPYNPRVDDYAVPKRAQRACPLPQSTNEEEGREEEPQEEEEEEEEREEQQDSPYNNVMLKMM